MAQLKGNTLLPTLSSESEWLSAGLPTRALGFSKNTKGNALWPRVLSKSGCFKNTKAIAPARLLSEGGWLGAGFAARLCCSMNNNAQSVK